MFILRKGDVALVTFCSDFYSSIVRGSDSGEAWGGKSLLLGL